MEGWVAHALYGLAWVSFGVGHSALAGAEADLGRAKDWLKRRCGAGTRLAYNGIAVVHLGLVIGLGWWLLGDAPAFALPAWADRGLLALHVAGWVLMLLALRRYDGSRLLGLRQWRSGLDDGDDPEPEPLNTRGLNAWVRHPIYTAAFLLLWGAATDPFRLATAVWASLYLVIGSRFEERRLVALYGRAYRAYRDRVPAFLPWRGKVIGANEHERETAE